MSKKFHVNKNDQVKPCEATKRKCRFSENVHFESESSAQKFVEEKLSSEYGGSSFSTVKRNSAPAQETNAITVDNDNDFLRDENEPYEDDDRGNGNLEADHVYDVNIEAFAKLEKVMAKNNRRLEKAGIDQRFELMNVEKHKEIKHKDGGIFENERVSFSVNYPEISYNGYHFEARIEETESGNFLAFSKPGVELQGWRPESMNCEHCNKNISRNKVYSIKDEDGNRKVVGGQCVELYTGIKAGNLWAMEYDVENDLEKEDYESGPSEKQVERTDDLLALSYLLTEKTGYKNAAFGSESTAYEIDNILYTNGKKDPSDLAYAEEMIEQSKQVDVAKIKEEVREAIKNANNDWADNLRVLLNEDYVSNRGRNTVISAMAALHKYREKKNAKPWAKGFLGEKKDKIQDVKAKVLRAEQIEENYTYYPTIATKVTMQTESGHKVFWKTSSANVPEKGDSIVFKATVKDNSTWKDIDTTRVINAKWVKDEDTEKQE